MALMDRVKLELTFLRENEDFYFFESPGGQTPQSIVIKGLLFSNPNASYDSQFISHFLKLLLDLDVCLLLDC